MNRASFAGISALGVLLSGIALPALAQTETFDIQLQEGSTISGVAPMPEGFESCFDTYRFGSVVADVSSELSSAVQGAPIHFVGTLTNGNAYALRGVQVYAKVFRERGTEKDVNGPDVVAWFPAAEVSAIAANGSVPLAFSWEVPQDAEPGDYRIATYVTSGKRFELSGLTFTDDVIGSRHAFQVVGEDVGATRFRKDGVTINGRPFRFAAYPPRVARDGAAEVSAVIENTTAADATVTVRWVLSHWDDLSDETLITEETQELKVPAGGEATASFSTDDSSHSVYYLTGSFESAYGSASRIGIRFYREGVNEPRLSFVAVDPAQGGTSRAVACMHSTGNAPAETSVANVSVYRGGVLWSLLAPLGISRIAHASYEGAIAPDVYALAAEFEAPEGGYTVIAQLSQNGTVLASYTEEHCPDEGCSGGVVAVALMAAGVILVLIIVFFLARRIRS